MNYRILPLFYSASEHFKNTIRFTVEMNDAVDLSALQYAAAQAQRRYPYYSVKLAQEGEDYILAENDQPFVISNEDPVCLNSPESNYHLLAFAAAGNNISVDISHNICDGNGLAPLVKTLLYYYIERRYGADGIDTESIRLVTDPVFEDEYLYPFPDTPLPAEEGLALPQKQYDSFQFEDSLFDAGGPYAYHLQVRQKDLMGYAKPNDGSPISFISVMMYKALMALYPDTEKDITFQVPHEYRKALGRPQSHDCLARVFSVRLPGKDQGKDIELLNTAVRGQVILGSDESGDIAAINGMIQLGAYMQTLPLEGKKQAMLGLTARALSVHTFGISYTGNVDWGGMEQYIRDVHPYAGEMKFSGRISAEVFTIGEYFSICLFQPGKGDFFAKEMINAFGACGIDCRLTGEARYRLPDYRLP